MAFEFSDKDRELNVHHYDDDGIYLHTTKMLIEANTGLPAKSTMAELPELQSNQVAILDTQTQSFRIEYDYRGKTVYHKTTGESKEVVVLGDIEQDYTLEQYIPNSRFVDNEWVLQLDLFKENKHAEINVWRDSQENDESATVEVDGITYDADPSSRDRIKEYLAIDAVPVFWTSADNVDITPFTLDMLKAIQQAILDRGFLIHARQREMKQEITKLTVIDDIQNYSVGWKE